MSRYARGDKALAECQRSGKRVRYRDLVEDGRIPGLLVAPDWYEPQHPQEIPVPADDPVALYRPAPELSLPSGEGTAVATLTVTWLTDPVTGTYGFEETVVVAIAAAATGVSPYSYSYAWVGTAPELDLVSSGATVAIVARDTPGQQQGTLRVTATDVLGGEATADLTVDVEVAAASVFMIGAATSDGIGAMRMVHLNAAGDTYTFITPDAAGTQDNRRLARPIYVGGRWLVPGGDAGHFWISDDEGVTFEQRTLPTVTLQCAGMATDGTDIMAASQGSEFLLSSDLGETWTAKVDASVQSAAKGVYDPFSGEYVFAATNNTVLRGAAPGSMVVQSNASFGNGNDIATDGAGVLVVCGQFGRVRYFDANGAATWTNPDTGYEPANGPSLWSVHHAAGRFVAVGGDGTLTDPHIGVSLDSGVNWTWAALAPPGFVTISWVGVTYGNGLWVLTGFGSNGVSSRGVIAITTDFVSFDFLEVPEINGLGAAGVKS